jgi:hypothetical protein
LLGNLCPAKGVLINNRELEKYEAQSFLITIFLLSAFERFPSLGYSHSGR